MVCAGKSRTSTRSDGIDFSGDFAAVFRGGEITQRIFEILHDCVQLPVREFIISSFMSKENFVSVHSSVQLYITLLSFVFAI